MEKKISGHHIAGIPSTVGRNYAIVVFMMTPTFFHEPEGQIATGKQVNEQTENCSFVGLLVCCLLSRVYMLYRQCKTNKQTNKQKFFSEYICCNY